MKSDQANTRQTRAGLRFAFLLLVTMAGAAIAGLGDAPVLVFDPLSIVERASEGRGPSFLSIVAGRSDEKEVGLALGPPSRVDKSRSLELWRNTLTCERYDLAGVAVHYTPDQVVDWMELVLRHQEAVVSVEEALALGRPTGQRQEGQWTVLRYGPAGIELIVNNGRVGTLKLLAPDSRGQRQPASPDRNAANAGPLAPLRQGSKRQAPSYGPMHLMHTRREDLVTLLGAPDRTSKLGRTWYEGGPFCERHGLKRMGVAWKDGVLWRVQLDPATRMTLQAVRSTLGLGSPSIRRDLEDAGKAIEFYDPQGVALGLDGEEVFAVMLVSNYVEGPPAVPQGAGRRPAKPGGGPEHWDPPSADRAASPAEITGRWQGRFVHAESTTAEQPLTLDVSAMEPLEFRVTQRPDGYRLSFSHDGQAVERTLVREGDRLVAADGPPLALRPAVDRILVLTVETDEWRFEAHATRVD